MSEKAFDFDRTAASFDLFLPVTKPVVDAIADRATGLAGGVSVLDVACGTGEPGLTLAERHAGLQVLGVDASEVMIEIARRKAAARGLNGIRHEVMDSQGLALADDSVDVVVSRFGVLSFADPLAEAREIARVLRPGGTFSIATWDATSKNVLTYAMSSAAGERLPPQVVAAMRQQEHFAMPGRRESWLAGAGLSEVNSALFTWPVHFADAAAMWDLATGPAMLGAVVGNLGPEVMTGMRSGFDDLLSDYRQADGSYVLPYACRLLWGSR